MLREDKKLRYQLEEKDKIIKDYRSWLEDVLKKLSLMKSTRDTYCICVETYKNCLDTFNKIGGYK